MPEEIDNCVESVLDDNPEYSESRAYAICWAQKNEGNLSAETPEKLADFAENNNLAPECANKVLAGKTLDEDDPCWEGYTMVGQKVDENGNEVPNCVPDDEVPDAEMSEGCPEGQTKVDGECVPVEEVDDVPPSIMNAQFTLSELETEPIEREELGESEVVYRNVKVLESGRWTDSGSGEEIWYSPEGLKNLEVRDDNHINIMHDSGNDVSTVGEMENARAESGELYADLRLDTSSAAGEYADENLQQALETNGQQGFGGPSVEIDAEGQTVEHNAKMGVKELKEGFISGLGLVKNPASKPVHFARQTAERGVALSEGANTYRLEGQSIDMADIDVIRDTMAEAGVNVEEMDDEAVMDMAESLHGDLMDALEMGDYEDDEEEEEDMEMQDGLGEEEVLDLIQEEMDDLWGEIDELRSEMMGEEMAEELSDDLETAKEELAAAETVQELQDAKDDLEKRLESVESTTKELAEEPEEPRTMADGDFSDSDNVTNISPNYNPY